MVRFTYTAVLESGRRVKGTVKSATRREALAQLVGRGFHPLAIDPADGPLAARRFSLETFRRVSAGQVAVFTRQLAALLKAGLPIVEALRTLRGQSEGAALKSVIGDVVDTLSREGGTLADGLDNHPRVFDAVFRGMVAAGEESGNLPTILANLAEHLAKRAKLRRQVLSAFIYPIFLVLLGGAAVFVLVSFVIPRFQELFESFGQTLPVPTQVLIAVSNFMSQWWPGVLGGLIAAVVLIFAVIRKPAVRRNVDRAMLKLPVLGAMFTRIETARISRTLAALLGGGVRILGALRITGETARNQAIRASFPAMINGVSNGEPLAAVVGKAELFPPLMINLIRTGEETGELPEMLRELAEIYEDEAERAIAAAVKLIEPILIIVMGGIVAAIVAAVMLPIFQANLMAG